MSRITTYHATIRAQQRTVPPIVIDWLVAYGARMSAGNGCERLFFDKSARRRLARDLGSWAYNRLEHKLDTYAILSDDGAIVTVGFRNQRISR